MIKQAEGYARQLLVAQPDAQDAWLALGAADYIIGSLPAQKRFFLRFGGIHGDKKAGLAELRQTAEKGHYLRPYANSIDFPNNSLFSMELARLNKSRSPSSPDR